MRHPASEKLEIIQIVERSHLPARRTLERLGIPRSTFHRWYDRFLTGHGRLDRCAPAAKSCAHRRLGCRRSFIP